MCPELAGLSWADFAFLAVATINRVAPGNNRSVFQNRRKSMICGLNLLHTLKFLLDCTAVTTTIYITPGWSEFGHLPSTAGRRLSLWRPPSLPVQQLQAPSLPGAVRIAETPADLWDCGLVEWSVSQNLCPRTSEWESSGPQLWRIRKWTDSDPPHWAKSHGSEVSMATRP